MFNPGLVTRAAADEMVRDVRACSVIGSSPFIVAAIDCGVDEASGAPYLVTPLLDGETLASRIDKRGPLPSDEVATYASQLARALDQAHRANVAHGALRPSNLFLGRTPEGRPAMMLLDFGVTRVLSEAGHAAPDLAMASYLAPEQKARERATPNTDVWPLGLIAYEMLTGFPSGQFYGTDPSAYVTRRAQSAALLPSKVAGSQAALLPARFDEWFQKCVAKDPRARWQTAGEALRELDVIAGSSFIRPRTQLGDAVKSFMVEPNTPPVSTRGGTGAMPLGPAPSPQVAPRGVAFKAMTSIGVQELNIAAPSSAITSSAVAGVPRRKWIVPVVSGVGVVALAALVVAFATGKLGTGSASSSGGAATSSSASAVASGSGSANPPSAETLNAWVTITPPQAPDEWLMGITADAPLAQAGLRPAQARANGDHAPATPYDLQKHEVTWAEIDPWLDTHFGNRPAWAAHPTAFSPQLPATGIPWLEAGAYCASLGRGVDLPSEDELEYAARGSKRLRFPWGDGADVDSDRVHALEGDDGRVEEVAKRPKDCTDSGVCGLMGNAQEWTSEKYHEDVAGLDDEVALWAGDEFKAVRGLPLRGKSGTAGWSAAYREAVCAKGPCDPETAGGSAAKPVLRLRFMQLPPPADEKAPPPKAVTSLFHELHACIEPLAAGSPLIGKSARFELPTPDNALSTTAIDPALLQCVSKAVASVTGVAVTSVFDIPSGISVSVEVVARAVPKDEDTIGFRCARHPQ
jgi:serine/threonine-protein kinase